MKKYPEYINEQVYEKVAEKNDTKVSTVRDIMGFLGSVMADTINQDDPKYSVKLDYLGNLYSNPERRKAITIRKENKENGRPTDN